MEAKEYTMILEIAGRKTKHKAKALPTEERLLAIGRDALRQWVAHKDKEWELKFPIKGTVTIDGVRRTYTVTKKMRPIYWAEVKAEG